MKGKRFSVRPIPVTECVWWFRCTWKWAPELPFGVFRYTGHEILAHETINTIEDCYER